MPRSTRVLIILGAAALGIALLVQVLALPSVGGRLGLFRAYDPLPPRLVADLATGYASTADRYDALAGSPAEPGAAADDMRSLAAAERKRAQLARVELVVREVGRASFWSGIGLFLLGGITFGWKMRKDAKTEPTGAVERARAAGGAPPDEEEVVEEAKEMASMDGEENATPEPEDDDRNDERPTRVAEPVFDEDERTTNVQPRPEFDDSEVASTDDGPDAPEDEGADESS